jgi:cytochrome c-type biogenesis protein CcmH
MTIFTLLAVLMLALALGALVPTLARRRAGQGAAPDYDTRAVYRERLAELESEHARGNLSPEGFDEARAELEREVLQESERAESRIIPARSPGQPSRVLAAVVAIAVVTITLATYTATGRPGLLTADRGDRLAPEQVQRYAQMDPADRIPPLEEYVEAHPQAPRAWALLARSYRAEEQFGDAYVAFGRAREAGDDADAWLTARQAEALLLANGRRFTSGVRELLDDALDIEPSNPLALMLSGHAALSAGRDEQAVRHWQHLADTLPEGDDRRGMIEQLIARARGDAPGDSAAPATATGSAQEADGTTPRITVRVQLDGALGSERPGDEVPVFVFARPAGAAGGPPIAVARTSVGQLPTEVTLSDEQAMMAGNGLSGTERVIVTARVALSGDVMPSTGDLEGRSGPVEVGPSARAEVTIDRRLD